MNIDEPPTPFEAVTIGDDADATPIPLTSQLSGGHLFAKLSQVQEGEQESGKKKLTFDESKCAGGETQSISEREAFERKRAAHYDEGRMLLYAQQLLDEMNLEEDEEQETGTSGEITDVDSAATQATSALSTENTQQQERSEGTLELIFHKLHDTFLLAKTEDL